MSINGPAGGPEPVLGRIEPLDPRIVWAHEAHNFTPWLFANAERLAEKLGIDIEFEAMEQPVGGYYLDLIGRDQSNGVGLIVENQLADSDHSHLGQLLTYAAGTGAATIVWITTRLREEHRQALTWLNEHTDTETLFFGVELKLLRIGDSVPAPDFDVVVEPNNWQKTVRQASASTTEGSERGNAYRAFWTRFLDRARAEHPTWTRAKPGPNNWMWIPSPGLRGCATNPVFTLHGVRVELYIDRPTKEECLSLFTALAERRQDFDAAYGRPLEWDELAGRKACRIFEMIPGDITQVDQWDRYVEFYVDGITRMRRAVAAVGASL